eukprot:gb/GECG01008786.1/.p1 GENE.gb/GECG01008786.1/~~gb/GECG01008786.1/.p1  ORF type:complete len:220 (+),score=40.26 gb/GECG01008786.1/:1-660(+)
MLPSKRTSSDSVSSAFLDQDEAHSSSKPSRKRSRSEDELEDEQQEATDENTIDMMYHFEHRTGFGTDKDSNNFAVAAAKGQASPPEGSSYGPRHQRSQSLIRKQPVQEMLQELYRTYSYQQYREQGIAPPTLDRLNTSVVRSNETLEAFCDEASEILLDVACAGVAHSYRKRDGRSNKSVDEDYSELLFGHPTLSQTRPLAVSKQDIQDAWEYVWNDEN